MTQHLMDQLLGQAGLLVTKLRHGDPCERTAEAVFRLLVALEPDEPGDEPFDPDYDERVEAAERENERLREALSECAWVAPTLSGLRAAQMKARAALTAPPAPEEGE